MSRRRIWDGTLYILGTIRRQRECRMSGCLPLQFPRGLGKKTETDIVKCLLPPQYHIQRKYSFIEPLALHLILAKRPRSDEPLALNRSSILISINRCSCMCIPKRKRRLFPQKRGRYLGPCDRTIVKHQDLMICLILCKYLIFSETQFLY